MTAYDVLTYTPDNDLDISSIDFLPTGIFFKPDGFKMFITGQENSSVYEFNLSSKFDISTAVLFQSKVVPSPTDLFFKEDGLKMFILDSGETLTEYDLSTPWDISTAVFFQSKFINVDSGMRSFFINETGTIMFTCGFGGNIFGTSDRLYRYTFGTPWDVSTIVNPSVSPDSYHTAENFPAGIWQHPDQNVIFYMGKQDNTSSNDRSLYSHTQSPNNALGGGIGARIQLEVNARAGTCCTTFDNAPNGLFFSKSGQSFYYVRRVGQFGGAVHQWSTQADDIEFEFKINAILTKDFQNFFVGSKLIVRKEKEFFIGARLVLFCDTINSDEGWVITNGSGQILIDDPSFPNVIHFSALAGGAGTDRWARKDIEKDVSGDVKLEFSYDFQAMNGSTTSRMSIFLQEDNIHPDNSTGSQIGCILDETSDDNHHLYGVVTDGVSTITSIQGGSKNQRTTHVYPDNQPGGVDSELLGPYFVTVELKDSKLRMSIFLDESKTIHARGSPREVDATGINPTNLRFIVIGNRISSSSTRQFTGDIDDIYVTQNEPLPLLSVNTQTDTLIEDWESYAEFEQNPDGWFGEIDLGDRPNNEFNVSSAIFNQGFTEIFGLLNNVRGMFIRKDTGQQLYVVNPSTRKINEFLLPTPWSLTGAVFNLQGDIFAGTGGIEQPSGIHWKDNGFRVYTIDPNLSLDVNNVGNMKEWSTSSGAFDLIGSLILVKEENTRDELNEGRTVGISLNPLGTRLYIVTQALTAQDIIDGFTDSIYQYNMDIQPFNIGNRGLPVGSLAIANGMASPQEMWMSDDGLKLIVIGTNQVNEYNLGTAFEINTAVFASSRNVSPASNTRGVHMKPDGLKMFLSDTSGATADHVFEYDIPTTFIPSIDIKQVSTEFPNGGIKSYKLHTKYSGDGITDARMSSSVIGKRVLTPPNPDGGELLIPYGFTAKARSEIMSVSTGADQVRGGVYIRYELLQGTPFDTQEPNDGLAIIMFRGITTPANLPVNTFNDLTSSFSVINRNTGSPLETDEPEGSYFTTEANLRDIFHADSVFDSRGWDFESHVKSISIGYWVDSLNTTTGDVETLMYGDEINLIPEITKGQTFTVNGILQAFNQEKEFFVSAFLQAFNQEKEFFVDGLAGGDFIILDFFVGAKIVIRQAQNGTQVTARLIALDQKEEFKINALLIGKDQEKEFLINAILNLETVFTIVNALIQKPDNEEEFTVNGITKGGLTQDFFINAILEGVIDKDFIVNAVIVRAKTFTINALLIGSIDFIVDANIGDPVEPQSILEVESVIGHKTGLQS